MTDRTVPDLPAIARAEERRQAKALAGFSTDRREVAGGVAARGEPGSWMNNMVGIGLDCAVSREEIEALVAWYVEKGCEPRIEVCPFVDPSLLPILEALGFVLRGFECSFFRALSPHDRFAPVHAPPAGLTVRLIGHDDEPGLLEYTRVAMSGFYPEGQSPLASDVEAMVKGCKRASVRSFVAELDGRVVGSGGMSLVDDAACLYGVSVLPPFRRRGIQQALLAERLGYAAKQGAAIAVIGSRPGAPTERNAMRMGFGLAYTKAVLCRPGPGLTPTMG